MRTFTLRSVALTLVLAAAPFAPGCVGDTGSDVDDITDVQHTDVERQSIGNCWIYAQSSWVESMHLAATGEQFDNSQSYWTYWHWYDQITGYMPKNEINTGGGQGKSNGIVRDRGLMNEADFVPEDETSEMSDRQHEALETVNWELKSGRLKTQSARSDGKLVRQVLDEAWGLSDDVRAQLDTAFGEEGDGSLRYGATVDGTKIIDPAKFAVQYTVRKNGTVATKKTDLVTAIKEWKVVTYPKYGSSLETSRRNFLIRVQRALHDRQPVVITWNVDFNALENWDEVLRGSFNMTTLKNAGGPGRQGGHMTVLEDYEVETQQYGVLPAGETLDPSKPTDQKKLDAALLPSSKVRFLRIKNSWGTLRPDREFAPGFPGYHDLYMDYLNGPITWCPDIEGTKTPSNCTGSTVPFSDVMLPPGY